VDFASNDYLGLAENKKLLKKAYKKVKKYKSFAPKSSQLPTITLPSKGFPCWE